MAMRPPPLLKFLLNINYICRLDKGNSLSKLNVLICHSQRDLSVTVPAFQKSDLQKAADLNIPVFSARICQTLQSSSAMLNEFSCYHFDGNGKAFRPVTVLLMAQACNFQMNGTKEVNENQMKIAEISEMIHTASLIHDDVVDQSELRRGKQTIQAKWGANRAILTGDYIMSMSSIELAKIGNKEVVKIISTILEDLVEGEFMQLGSKSDENERFEHYLKKTYKKTASLLANSCKAVAVLANCPEEIVEVAFQFGRNIGIAFQIIDDILDFVSSEELLGKPAAADLKLGLATAPVLFALQEYPELESLIMRRFSIPGDVEKGLELTSKSNGLAQSRMLAEKFCSQAVKEVQTLKSSQAVSSLVELTRSVIERNK